MILYKFSHSLFCMIKYKIVQLNLEQWYQNMNLILTETVKLNLTKYRTKRLIISTLCTNVVSMHAKTVNEWIKG